MLPILQGKEENRRLYPTSTQLCPSIESYMSSEAACNDYLITSSILRNLMTDGEVQRKDDNETRCLTSLNTDQDYSNPVYSDETRFGYTTLADKTGPSRYKCNMCKYSATDTFRIKRHLSSHKTEREHKCELCNSCFKDKSTLRSHEKIHTDVKPHRCTYCDYATVRSTSLKLHMRIHTGEKPFVCAYCGHSSAYQRHFKLHLMRVHFKVKPFQCDACDYTTTEAFHLKKHKQSHEGKAPTPIRTELRREPTGDKEFHCSECPFVTTRNSSLNRHLKIHTGDKPFVCVDCGHATAYKNHLALHRMRAHLGLKPHQCSLCTYSASASSQLKRHMLTHAKNFALAENPTAARRSVEASNFVSVKIEDGNKEEGSMAVL